MSRQMIHLGRPDDALELIHLAQYGSRDCATARTQAMLYAMEARAYANMGQPSKCKRAVRMAEDTFADAGQDGEPEPDWIRFFSEAELNGENAHSYRDLAYVAGRSPTYASLAEPVMRRAVELFGKDEEHQRSYALNLVGMATVHLLKREPEQSTAWSRQALDVARKVRSERVNTRLRKTVDTAARDFGDVAEVAHLTDLLTTQLAGVRGSRLTGPESGRGRHPVQPDTAPPRQVSRVTVAAGFRCPAVHRYVTRRTSSSRSVKHRAALAETALRQSPQHSRPRPP